MGRKHMSEVFQPDNKPMVPFSIMQCVSIEIPVDCSPCYLWYALLEKEYFEEDKSQKVYDILIREYRRVSWRALPVLIGTEETNGFTEDYGQAKKYFELLVREVVMPESLLSILDDLMYGH